MLHWLLMIYVAITGASLFSQAACAAELNHQIQTRVTPQVKLKKETLQKVHAAQRMLKERVQKSAMGQVAEHVGRAFSVPLEVKQQAAKLVEKSRNKGFIEGMKMVERVFPEQEAARLAHEDMGDRLYLFISASVPMMTLRNYARALEDIPGAVMVMRGFVRGADRLKPTMQFVRRIRLANEDCKGDSCALRNTAVVVDPVLFRRYGIERVPALVAAEGVETPGTCSEGNPDVVKVAASSVIYGDAGIDGLLGILASDGNQAAVRYRALMQEPVG